MDDLMNFAEQLRHRAENRCGYCLTPQHMMPEKLPISYIVSVSRGGNDDDDNLWLVCPLCQLYKGDHVEGRDPLTSYKVSFFNPYKQFWFDHFRWSKDGTFIVGKTDQGRATVLALNLNHLTAVIVRRHWISAGWQPPSS
jgi:hypothetical protein